MRGVRDMREKGRTGRYDRCALLGLELGKAGLTHAPLPFVGIKGGSY